MSAQVYRVFDAAGRLLYVGCSVDVDARLRYHEEHSMWWPFHTRIERQDFPTREEAAAAETEAIATEHPRWNIKDRSREHPDGAATSIGGAEWLEYELDVARRLRQLTAEEQQLLRQIRRVRFALAGVKCEVEAVSNGTVEIDEDVA